MSNVEVPEKKRLARTMLAQGASVPEITKALGYRGDIATRQLISRIHKEDHPTPKVAPSPEQAPSDAEGSPSSSSVPPLGAAPAGPGDRSELDLLTEMLEALWPDAQEGKLGAIDRILKIQQRRAELGAGAPASRQDVIVKGEVSNVDKFLSRLAERSPNLQGRAAS